MKTITYLTAILSLFMIFSCKKERNKTMTVDTNCTGVYLRIEDKAYKVCNIEKMSSFEHGQTVKATYKKIADCDGPGGKASSCYLSNPFESYIEVKKIE